MGASESVTIQVNFNRLSKFYYTREQVSGNVLLQNNRDTLKLDEIFIELVGELGYSTQETRSSTDSNGNTTTEYYTDYHHLPFLTLRVPFAQPDLKQDKITLSCGSYTWPFEFSLPKDLPPSSAPNPQSYPHIRYYTRVVLDRSWYKRNITQTHSLMICPSVYLLHENYTQETLHFSGQNRKHLYLQGYLLHGVIIPGQSLLFQINLDNPEHNHIKRIEASLIQHRETAFDRRAETICSINLPGLSEFNESHLQRNVELLVPQTYLTPTYTFTAPSHGRSYYLKVHYELRLQVKSHGLFTNFETSVPVMVGTESTTEGQHRQNNYNFTMLTNSTGSPVCDENDMPPSYKMVTKNK